MRLAMLFLLGMFSLQAFSQIENQILFRGQNAEHFKINKSVNVVRPKPIQVPSTCTRDIPYQRYECNDVTRYREQCTTIPSREECRDVYERVCRPVTRTREECSTGPSREVCVTSPVREVCVDRPTREICRTAPNGTQACNTVGGGRSCHNVGGDRSCHSAPGERICRNVSYTDQDCDNVSRRRCETIPSRRDCSSIPYTENECGNVTYYRQEQYSCMRTEYVDETSPKKLVGELNVQIQTNGIAEEFPLAVLINSKDLTFKQFAIEARLNKEPKSIVVLKSKSIEVLDETAKEIVLSGNIILEVLDPQAGISLFPDLTSASINKNSQVLMVEVLGPHPQSGLLELELKHKRNTLAEVKTKFPSNMAEFKLIGGRSFLQVNLDGHLSGRLRSRKMSMTMKLTSDLPVPGVILNAKKPVSERRYEQMSVELD